MLSHLSLGGGRKVLLAAGVLVIALVPVARAGTVTIISQHREITARAAGEGVGRTAPDAGPFSATASVDASDDTGIARATTTVDSRLGQDGFFFSGRAAYDKHFFDSEQGTGPSVLYRLTFEVIFSIDEPYNYEYALLFNNIKSDPTADSSAEFEFSGDPDALGDPPSRGTFEAGTYRLFLTSGAESIGRAGELISFEEEYDWRLALSPVDGDGDPTPIPLPPALWAGLSVMGLGLLNRWRKSLRA